MSEPSSIIGTWFHSYEEDTDTARVYRPRGFPFPRSRGPHVRIGATMNLR